MRGWLFFLMIVVVLFSCEDPTTLPVSKVFNGNRLGTIYVDTFSVLTSTVQLDSVLTSGTGQVLIGKYTDDSLGTLSASSYFQMSYAPSTATSYTPTFLPDIRSIFDSVSLIMHYNHTYSGDTTKPVTINLYQLSELMNVRTLPTLPYGEYKIPSLPMGGVAGFYNNTEFSHYPTPIVSTTVKFKPHTDSLYIKLPYSFGANWFRLAQADSGNLFSNVSRFLTYYFYGLYMNVDASADAAVVGFKGTKVVTADKPLALRLYYRQLYGDLYRNTHFDFSITSSGYQFNHIEYDRSTGAPRIANAFPAGQKLQAISTSKTANTGYIQSGTGLVGRLDFPSLKGFFALNSGIILSAAYLDIYPVQGSYSKDFLPPPQMSLFTTDGSSIPLLALGLANGGVANINYDLEYGNTFYRYQMYPYMFSQLKASTNFVTPLIIAPTASQGTSVQRMFFGDRFKVGNKIKLKIYYTSTLN